MTGWFRLDANGYPRECATMDEYHRWAETPEGKAAQRVGDDMVNGIRVSTVYLGLDHGGGYGRYLWETMTFGGESWGIDQQCKRYGSLEEAREGHAAMMEKVRLYEPPTLTAVLKQLHDTERVLRTFSGAMWLLKWSCGRSEEVPTPAQVVERIEHYEKWVSDFLNAAPLAPKEPA